MPQQDPNPAPGTAPKSLVRQPEKPRPTSGTRDASLPKDSLKLLMPAGEDTVRNPSSARPATANSGTSGAEDTTRTAGYVVDLETKSEPPPGPPVKLDPAQLDGPEAVTAPPKKSPGNAQETSPGGTQKATAAPKARTPR